MRRVWGCTSTAGSGGAPLSPPARIARGVRRRSPCVARLVWAVATLTGVPRPPKGPPACGDGIEGYAVHRPWFDLREMNEVTTSSVEGVSRRRSPSVEPRSSSPSAAVRRVCLSVGRDVMRVNTGVMRGCTCARHGGYSIGMVTHQNVWSDGECCLPPPPVCGLEPPAGQGWRGDGVR